MIKKVEVRFKNIQNALKHLNYDIDIIGVGSESCIHKLPSVKDIKRLLESVNQNKKVKVIIPFVPQCYIDEIKKYIQDIVELGYQITFVVNDYGILYYMSSLDSDLISINLGRFLEKSMDLIPWKDNLLRSEKEDNKKVLKQSSFSHRIKLEFFEEMKVTGIETNLSDGLIESFDLIKQCGFETCVHYKNNTMAYTRACPVKRYFLDDDICSIRCSEKCEELFELEFYKKWDSSDVQNSDDLDNIYIEDNNVKVNYPKLYVSGNLILRKNSNELKDISNEKIDCLILDEFFINDIHYILRTIKNVCC